MDNIKNTNGVQLRTIYLAGGCFWGIEKLMKSLPGVKNVTNGYANGTCEDDANYETVCSGRAGFRETVKVEYDPAETALEAILASYFYVIDATQENRQGPDVGAQYQTGIYYEPDDEKTKSVVEHAARIEEDEIDRIRVRGGVHSFIYFCVEIEPLRNFYPAEEYHQDYLDKNPNGYCHVSLKKMRLLSQLSLAGISYDKPAAQLIDEYARAQGL